MARKRMIDPGFWTDEALGTCTPVERLLFMGLISQADDEGRLRGTPALIRSQVFPYDESLSSADVDTMLDTLARHRLIQRYVADGQSYIWIRSFAKHQTINRPSQSQLPVPPVDESSTPVEVGAADVHGSLTEDSVSDHAPLTPNRKEEKLREVKGRELVATAAPPRESGSRSSLAARPRNALWDAVEAQVGGPETDSEKADFGKTIRELRSVNATEAEIAAFPDWWRSTYPDTPLTHRCFRNHFGPFRNTPPGARASPRRDPNARAMSEYERNLAIADRISGGSS